MKSLLCEICDDNEKEEKDEVSMTGGGEAFSEPLKNVDIHKKNISRLGEIRRKLERILKNI